MARHRRAVTRSGRSLSRLTTGRTPDGCDEIRLFTKVRNEAKRLPHFFEYYRDLGVDRFFLVDNMSTDGTVEFAKAEPDVTVFQTSEPLTQHGLWIEFLLSRFGQDRWCVVADADELLVLPSIDTLNLRQFAVYLSAAGCDAVRAVLLDMYPRGRTGQRDYTSGEDFLDYCDYFDPDFSISSAKRLNPRQQRWFETVRFSGGTRERVYGVDVNLTKIPFFKYHKNLWLSEGAHAVDGAKIADARAVMLHFKYLHDFANRTAEATERGVYADGGGYYSSIAAKLTLDPDPDLWFEQSRRLLDLRDLLDAGLLLAPPDLVQFVAQASR